MPLGSSVILWRRGIRCLSTVHILLGAGCALARGGRGCTAALWLLIVATTLRCCNSAVKIKLRMHLDGLLGLGWINRRLCTATRVSATTTAWAFLVAFAVAFLRTIRVSRSIVVVATSLATTTVAAPAVLTAAFTATIPAFATVVIATTFATRFLIAVTIAVDFIIVVIAFNIGVRAAHVIEDALVVIRKLIIIFSHHAVAGLLGLTRLVFVFFKKLLRIAANFRFVPRVTLAAWLATALTGWRPSALFARVLCLFHSKSIPTVIRNHG